MNGEGLQHEDGHSHVLFSVVPNCRAYDPTFGYEVAVIIQEGLQRMLVEQEDVFYYLTLMNENYVHPAMPDGSREGILRGMYLLREAPKRSKKPRVQLLGSGTILNEVLAAAELLDSDFDVQADVWSVTSFTELRRDGIEVERCEHAPPARRAAPRLRERVPRRAARAGGRLDRLHTRVRRPDPPVGAAAATGCSAPTASAAATPRRALRRFFEVDRHYVAVAALSELAAERSHRAASSSPRRSRQYDIDPEAPMPTTV